MSEYSNANTTATTNTSTNTNTNTISGVAINNYSIGVDVGGTKIAYGLFDADYRLIDKLVAKTDPTLEPVEMTDAICNDIRNLVSRNSLRMPDIKGVGAAFPSHIDTENGVIITTASLPKWDGIPVKSMLSERLGLRAEIDNDANAAAIAEHRFGAGKGERDMLYVTISTGVGGGIIINDRIYRGSYGAAGEFGHMIISNEGYVCGCGNIGCVMSLASGPKIEQYAVDRLKSVEGVRSSLTSMVDSIGKITCKHIEDAANAGDAFSMEVINRTGDILGVMFANLYQIFNIKRFVVGGSVSKFGKPLFDRIEEKFAKLMKISASYPVEIKRAQLGDDAGIIGAATLVE